MSYGSGVPAVQQGRRLARIAVRKGLDFSLCGRAQGSNGIVYSALWHGARVAVKFLLGSADDSAHLQRCLTEAVLTRVLSHPCVVQCFATAIAQMEPEVGEAIRMRCNRQQLLKSSSMVHQAAARDAETALSTADISGVQHFMIGGGSTVGARDSFLAVDKSLGVRSACMSPEGLGSSLLGVGKDDETAMLELRKMENFFVDESPSASLGTQANLEGVSIQQALQDLQAEPGRHCTVVIMEYMDAGAAAATCKKRKPLLLLRCHLSGHDDCLGRQGKPSVPV